MTIIIITGVVNAFNLMDGIDGLAAGMAIVGFAIFTVLATVNGQHYAAIIFLTSIGALLAFLRYNLSQKKKIFMGDAGSLIIGFVMVVFGITLDSSSSRFNTSFHHHTRRYFQFYLFLCLMLSEYFAED